MSNPKKISHENRYSEAPSLTLEYTDSSAGFITREITIKATGSSLQEAARGVDFLIDRLKKNREVFGHA